MSTVTTWEVRWARPVEDLGIKPRRMSGVPPLKKTADPVVVPKASEAEARALLLSKALEGLCPSLHRIDATEVISFTRDEATRFLLGQSSLDVRLEPYKRAGDGTLQPFISQREYDELREDDRFLYNVGDKPAGLV